MTRIAMFRNVALAAAIPAVALSAPAAQAATFPTHASAEVVSQYALPVTADEAVQHRRDRRDRWNNGRFGRYDDRRYDDRRYDDRYRSYGEPVRRDTRVWRGDDGRVYCRKENGTTGLLIGGAVGGLIGNEIAGRGDRTLGAILGAAGGALLGREIDRSNSRCR
ncbi:glycine zipper 2TM domain-containing protein [Croceicoccus hydrothermalis]|uniref:glycine zipper 2TM domain-containing protein n=1 Tax=Croceicoccus hydrothermalis TaxID=2867964 RepID=UPI001EFA5792|nr:glycine zipper 2TM domain-containing protein [Croceicoccus hydrothermalis]